jgi:hypothetical protein
MKRIPLYAFWHPQGTSRNRSAFLVEDNGSPHPPAPSPNFGRRGAGAKSEVSYSLSKAIALWAFKEERGLSLCPGLNW